MNRTWGADLLAGTVVFLVALPLCLGIALASGMPVAAGLIAGVVGGLVVGALGGSPLSVSGPAAGLILIVLGAVQTLGIPSFLVALVIAGLLQVALGALKAGIFAHFVPHSVIKGMLAAIGITLILKQLPHAVGWDHDFEGSFVFFQADGETTLSELLQAAEGLTYGACLVAAVSFVFLLGWPLVTKRWTSGAKGLLKALALIPGPLLAVLAGTATNLLLGQWAPTLRLTNEHLVQLPIVGESGFAAFFTWPQWSAIANPQVWVVALMLLAVASLESLLSVEAVDRLDPRRRSSDPNRELLAQGVGNTLCGLVGGMPITSVIVRSATNVEAGGQTRLSAVVHGVWLLVAVLLIPQVLNHIPLASLAAVLLLVGYKLTKAGIYRAMFAKGWGQFVPFMATILATVFKDLLVGIGVGLLVSIVLILSQNVRNKFTLEEQTDAQGPYLRLQLPQIVTFLHKAALLQALFRVPEGSRVVIDATHTTNLDADVLEALEEFVHDAPLHRVQAQLLFAPSETASATG